MQQREHSCSLACASLHLYLFPALPALRNVGDSRATMSTPAACASAGDPLPLPPAGVASFAPLLRHSLNAFAVVHASGRYAWVSDSMCTLLGLEKEALLGCGPDTRVDVRVCVRAVAAAAMR